MQVAPDQLFFATGSEDGTVKIWDTIRLEKNVTSRSRQTFQQGGKITSVCIIENSHCVASASNNGTLWIHRVDVSLSGSMPKYGKQQLIRQQKSERPGEFVTCIASYNTGELALAPPSLSRAHHLHIADTTTNLILGTSLSSIVVLDIRTMRNLYTFANPLPFGPVSCLCIDSKRIWLVVGTTSGVLTLWDLRFGLLLRSWSVGKGRVHKVAVHPCRGKGRWVVVAMEEEGGDEGKTGSLVAEVWDIDRGLRVEDFRAVSPGQVAVSSRPSTAIKTHSTPTTMQEALLDPAAAIEALLAEPEATTPKPRSRLSLPSTSSDSTIPVATSVPAGRASPPGVRAFLVGVEYSIQVDARPATTAAATPAQQNEHVDGTEGKKDAGYLITGGEDRKLRFWDLGRASKSSVISGLDIDDEVPTFS